MNITLINHNDLGGGAATASWRMLKAYQSIGLSPNLLVAEKKSKEKFVHSVYNADWQHKMPLAFEKLYLTPFQQSKDVRFQFTVPYFGKNISQNPLIQQSDILQLHWFHKSFLSLKNLEQLAKLNKPIIWTLHDMWAFTGGCHYTEGCENFKQNCGNCHYLKKPSEKDLSAKIWQKKQALYQKINMQFVTCSHWLKNIALESSLLKNQSVVSIPNPINIRTFQPKNKQKTKQELGLPSDKKLILFVAMNINEERKGFKYLAESLNLLKQKDSDFIENTELLIMGKADSNIENRIPIKANYLGFLNQEQDIVNAYNAADLFVLPSLQDNLPNVIMEALACGTPCVGFETGGIPEMIDHKKNGYVSAFKNAEDLANGIHWVLENDIRYFDLADSARNKVLEKYAEAVVAKQYITLYEQLLDKSKKTA